VRMADDTLRQVTVTRLSHTRHEVTNVRGGTLSVGGAETDFTPIELLLAGIGACTGLDVDHITSRRGEPTRFAITVQGHKIRDEQGNRLVDLEVVFDVAFPDGEAGDPARAALPRAVQASHDRLCTVSRTVEIATPIRTRIDGAQLTETPRPPEPPPPS
jgi:putative redox protein